MKPKAVNRPSGLRSTVRRTGDVALEPGEVRFQAGDDSVVTAGFTFPSSFDGVGRGVFTSVPNLIEAIEIWTEHWNDDPKPFVWHKQAEEIIAKVRRGRAVLTQVKSATRH